MFQVVTSLLASADGRNPLLVNAIVVAESLWVLERQQKISAKRARPVLFGFLNSSQISVSSNNPFSDWASVLEHGHRDFSDRIIAQVNLELGCEYTLTLDKRAARDVPGMKLLT